MAGNPCAKAEDFRLFMAAYVPKLEYYDYKKITKEEKVEGRTLHLYVVQVFMSIYTRLENQFKKMMNGLRFTTVC